MCTPKKSKKSKCQQDAFVKENIIKKIKIPTEIRTSKKKQIKELNFFTIVDHEEVENKAWHKCIYTVNSLNFIKI